MIQSDTGCLFKDILMTDWTSIPLGGHEPASVNLPDAEGQGIGMDDKKTVLLVDDDSYILMIMEKVLSKAGFGMIKTATNGKDALEALGLIPMDSGEICNSDIDIAVLDVFLPDTNGFEICRKLRSANRDIPVILISGYDIEEIQNKVIECGAEDFLEKPFNPAALSTRVNLLLNRKRRRQSDTMNTEPARIKFNMNHSVPFIGDNIDGYVITEPLGWGKFSLVYKVVNSETGRIYSLKMLSRNSIHNRSTVERFRNEIEIMSRLSHPSIVEYVGSGCCGGCPYLVMEYVNGVDLEEYLVTSRFVPLTDFGRIAQDIASAMSELHRNNIYHRDIKLKNILYDTKSGDAKLSDFGIAKLPESLSTTQEGFVVGTPLYLAPEIFVGDPASIQTDIYSYGASLYHLLTGSPPFVADSSVELFRKHRLSEPPSIKALRPELPEELDNFIIGKCLAKDPVDRPESMEYVHQEIGRIVEGFSPTVPLSPSSEY